ncbi:holo-ACP synthase [Thermodesulforhabdus norvegica]|uniref:Holo-[acyl-carrier-protein] synthase n=1 Tax=Thermodesulforhabdus norvegica TaxID=39841 RepID=A0A1I4QP64_9BACT|nr:holo-ACP synthase [Thermodesulforhabdus norvegica]SFM41505.1 holo-[acyl-carrier protein] synthase [Thermodesulforhabdus norvegica]
MAIRGIGIDMVKVDRIADMVCRWGRRFTGRVFTDYENSEASKKAVPYRYYALRFAAKEAFSKALGTGIRTPVRWRSVEVRTDELGRPYIVTSPELRKFCHDRGVYRWHLSLSDEGEYAVACVVMEGFDE